MLILSSDHNHGKHGSRGTQNIVHKNKNVISDMIDLYILLGQKGTMFFNGIIGNSQLHFHFHTTSEIIPIQNLLYNENDVDYDVFKTKNNNKILLFKNNKKDCVNGIIFYGSYQTLGIEIFKFLQYINKKNLLYNILFIENKNKSDDGTKITCIIYLRKKIKKENVKDYNLGSSSIGGIMITNIKPKEKLNSKKLAKSINKYCDVTVVNPTKDYFKTII